MDMLIVCPKDRGNTYDVCRYVAEQLGCTLDVVSRDCSVDPAGFGTILLASGIYGKKIHDSLVQWIAALPGGLSGRFYLFTTSLSPGDYQHAGAQVRQLLEAKGLRLEEDQINCFGKNFLLFRRCRPHDEDRRNVLAWARKITRSSVS